MLTNMKEMLCEARRAGRAVGAFNVANYETALAVFRAAEAEKAPVIVQLYMRLFDTGKARDLAPMLRGLAERATVPVALHLDHGSTEKQAEDALAWGYTSVMFDGSRLPYAENAARTKAVADRAHAAGATCEGEIGHVAMGDGTALTDVAEAAASRPPICVTITAGSMRPAAVSSKDSIMSAVLPPVVPMTCVEL